MIVHVTPVKLFEYLDYREYLKAWFEAAKQTRAGMSYRLFSKRAGLKSTNFIMLVMQGKRNLSDKAAKMVAKGLKLSKEESEFFRYLVLFNQAEAHNDKALYYEQMLQFRQYRKHRPISQEEYAYCSQWYHAAIRELILDPDFDGKPTWIAERLGNRISREEAAESLKLLQKLNFVQRTPSGRWQQQDVTLTAGSRVVSLELFNYHLSMMALSPQLLESLPGQRRDMSAVTMGIAAGRLPELKKKLQKFRKSLLKFSAEAADPEEVVQVNLYMFPLTVPKGCKDS